MRVAVNALSAKLGSGPTFFRNFLPALAAHTEHDYCVVLGRHQEDLIALLPDGVEVRLVSPALRSFTARVVWEQAVLPFLLRRWEVDVLYSTGNVTTLATSVPRVVVVTTANPFSGLATEWSPSQRLKLRALLVASHLSARRAARVIFISDNSRGLLWQRLGVPHELTAVVPYGCTPPTAGHLRSRQKPYLLTVSVLMPYKNIGHLLQAFDTLVRRTGFGGNLVVAGPPASAGYYRKLLDIRSGLAHGRRIELTGAIDQVELEALYEHALAFVFPSLEETLGIPLQEAMGAGLPIAAADTSISGTSPPCFNPCREVCEEAAIYFDPFDVEDITSALEQLVTDDGLRRQLMMNGRQQVKELSWERTAGDTLAVLEGAAALRRIPPSQRSGSR
ncbi:MAG: glycosyltransferase family 4 protein [Acidimicrobiales bacterium]